MTHWKADGEMLICGVSVQAAPIVTDTMIRTKFGPVYYSPESVANVISYHNIKQIAHRVWQLAEEDHFNVQMIEGGDIYIFRPKMGVYVHNLYNSRDTQKFRLSLVTTVTELKNNYTVREVQRAEEARELSKRLGSPSDEVLIKFMESGSLLNCPLTSKDIKRAHDIFGPGIQSLKGKAVAHKGVVMGDIPQDYIERPIHRYQILQILCV